MAKELSPIAKSLIVLLNNVEELIVKSNDRTSARDVMSAIVAYSKGKNHTIPMEKIDNFYAMLLDGRPETLSFIVKDIAIDVVSTGVIKES